MDTWFPRPILLGQNIWLEIKTIFEVFIYQVNTLQEEPHCGNPWSTTGGYAGREFLSTVMPPSSDGSNNCSITIIHNVLLFSLLRTRTPWAHTWCFLLLIISYEYYEARSAISLESDERIVFTPFSGSQTRNIWSTQFSQSNSFFSLFLKST